VVCVCMCVCVWCVCVWCVCVCGVCVCVVCVVCVCVCVCVARLSTNAGNISFRKCVGYDKLSFHERYITFYPEARKVDPLHVLKTFVGTRSRPVVKLTPVTILPPGKKNKHGTQWIVSWVGPRAGLEVLKINLLPLSWFESRTLQLVAYTNNTAASLTHFLLYRLNCHNTN